MSFYYRILTFTSFITLPFAFLTGQERISKVYKIDLQKEINAAAWIYTQQGFACAARQNADAILIHMNTYGGEVVYADSIRTKILNSEIPVYAFVDNNAASVGALIAIACDKIYMREGAAIGAATVVDPTGNKLPDKYQSYMRATMRATAEAHGKDTVVNGNDTLYQWRRDPLIAEAMVDERTIIPHVNDSGKVLSFSTHEAMLHGYCDGTAESAEEVIEKQLGHHTYELIVFEPTLWDQIKGFFMNSVVQGILIMLIIGGIYFEFQTPGIGLPLGTAALAAALYFVPLYIDGLAANWEIVLFFAGIILLVIEFFITPGFGLAGLSGILLTMAALILSMLENDFFNFKPVRANELGSALVTVAGGVVLGFAFIIWFSSKIGSKGLFKKIALQTTLDTQEGYVGVSMQEKSLVGQKGITRTVLRPSGKVEIDGNVYNAVSEQNFIPPHSKVIVTRYETGQLYVEETDE